MDPADVVEFLLLSRTFPRWCCSACGRSRTTSPGSRPGSATLARPQRILGRTRSDLEFLDTHELLQGDLHVFLDQMLNGVRQVAEAVALQYFRSAAGARLPLARPVRPRGRGRLMAVVPMAAHALDIRYRTTIHYDDVVRGSQNELRACPASDEHQQLVAYRVADPPRRRGALVPRLLGHPGRHVRRPRAARVPRDHRRGHGRDDARARSSPCRPGSPSSSEPAFKDAYVEYLEPSDAHRVGRRRVGGRRADRRRHRRRRRGHRAGAAPLRAHLARVHAGRHLHRRRRRTRCSPRPRACARTTPTSRWRCAAASASRPATCRATSSPARRRHRRRRRRRRGAGADPRLVRGGRPRLGLAGPRPDQRPAGRASAT